MNLKEELFQVIDILDSSKIEYALCGGLAVVIHGYPRLTRDIDVLIKEDDLDRSKEALKKIGYIFETGLIPFDKGKPTERKVYRTTKVDGEDHLSLDFILVVPFLNEIWEDREKFEVENRFITVISKVSLIKMKKIASRPQDLADISFLEGLDDTDG